VGARRCPAAGGRTPIGRHEAEAGAGRGALVRPAGPAPGRAASNLDARSRREFGELLGRLKAADKTLLFCTHRPSEVWKLADRVIVLERGRQVAEGPPEQVREYLLEPAHLGLTVADGEGAAAAERLRDGGFVVQAAGSRLWVDAPAGRKVEAIELLNRAGVTVLDFELEHERDSAGVPCRREA
jgi:ABC-type multidrug transport system ATPase subunit